MATIKIIFRPSRVAGRDGSLYCRVIHRRKVAMLYTGCRLSAAEWDECGRQIVTAAGDGARRESLAGAVAHLEHVVASLEEIIKAFELSGREYTAAGVADAYRAASVSGAGFVAFARKVIARLEQAGKWRTAETYSASLNSLLRFLGGAVEIAFDRMDAGMMMDYEAYLAARGLSANTRSFYMRTLRAIYNRAVEQGLARRRDLFKHVYTGVARTAKRAVTARVMADIKHLDLVASPHLEFARDMFMFSFYTRGMSFIDMAYLRKADLHTGILTYHRHKTGQRLAIKWTAQMQEIVDRYCDDASPYLLPIINRAGENERMQYLTAIHVFNKRLARIGRMVGCPIRLTSYVARHGWASIARSNNISVSVISEAMGHDSEATTRIYLASLDTSPVDNANDVVMNSIG